MRYATRVILPNQSGKRCRVALPDPIQHFLCEGRRWETSCFCSSEWGEEEDPRPRQRRRVWSGCSAHHRVRRHHSPGKCLLYNRRPNQTMRLILFLFASGMPSRTWMMSTEVHRSTEACSPTTLWLMQSLRKWTGSHHCWSTVSSNNTRYIVKW